MEQEQIGVKIENFARNSEIEIFKGIGITDFSLLLMLLGFLPGISSKLFGLDWKYMLLPGILYLIYVIKFKIGKEKDYFRHYCSYKFRDKLWKCENNRPKYNYELITRADYINKNELTEKLRKDAINYMLKPK